jgi:hypothetical protein
VAALTELRIEQSLTAGCAFVEDVEAVRAARERRDDRPLTTSAEGGLTVDGKAA